jgi:hypothetical protein
MRGFGGDAVTMTPVVQQAGEPTDERILSIASQAIGFDNEPGELQSVNRHDLINFARALLASRPQQPQAETPLIAQKYDDTLLPFLALMRRELHANSGKGDRPGWLTMSREQGLLEIYWHAAKLSVAVKKSDEAAIAEHSADVANMAMMLADVCGALAQPNTGAHPPAEKPLTDEAMARRQLEEGVAGTTSLMEGETLEEATNTGARPPAETPLTDDEVDSIIGQHIGKVSNLPEGNPVAKLNYYRDLVRAGASAVLAPASPPPPPEAQEPKT